ncbi:MAG: DUF4139 domain-containing protein [Gemmatimonadota bacterium]
MFRPIVTLLILTASATTLRAQAIVTPADRIGLGLTVYEGFGLVRDARRVPAGADSLVWTSVPRSVDPGTVLLRADDRTVAVASTTVESEQGPFGILRPGVSVVLVSPEGARIEAVVVSSLGPLFRAGDRLIAQWQGHFEVPDPAGALDPAPAIRWRLAEPTRAENLTASFLAGGLSWSADYVAVLESEERMSLDGNVTVQNFTGLAYPDATVQLIAGVVRRGGGEQPFEARGAVADAVMAMTAPAPDIVREALGEYHLYTIDEPVTLAQDATTQLNLFRAPRVPVERTLVLPGQSWWFQGQQQDLPPMHPEVRLRFQNDRASGLGEPLPAGVIHTYREDERGTLQFAGDGAIPHTPAGEEVKITIGQAFDVTARRVQTDWRRIDERTEESAWRVELRNGGERAREVVILETFSGEWTILEESHPHENIDARTARWTVTVPAEDRTELTYRVRVTY